MTAEPGAARLPRGLKIWLGLPAGLLASFLATGPWRLAGRDVGRLTAPLAAALLLAALGLAWGPWRRAAAARLRARAAPLSHRAIAAAALVAGLVLLRILFARWQALSLSAWDTTIYYDRPVAETLRGRFFFCDLLGISTFGNHVTAILFAFVPLYALWPSPLWMLAAEAMALAAAAAAAFLVFRRILGDDVSGGLLACGYLLCSATARTLQYGFHPEVFYPLAIFLLWLGLLSDRVGLLTAGTVLALCVKEDAVLPLVGFAFVAAVFYRKIRVAGSMALAAGAAFFVEMRFVLPYFSGEPAGRPWYGSYWASWGGSLPRAALSLLSHPARLAGALWHSGAPHLFEPFLLLPLAGPEALAGALPALVPYGASDLPQLRQFALYYSAPVLPFLAVAAAFGLARIARGTFRRRLGALLILAACAFDGASYTLERPNPARRDVGPALASLGERSVFVQGTLFPRAGYAAQRRVLDGRARPGGPNAWLLGPGTNPYPLSPSAWTALVRELSADPALTRTQTPNGLLLFTPAP
jgi:uncharacterized membrane protein